MISSVRVEGYRGLQEFEMNHLGRVNLLVGTNNSGKTSVLEAISLAASDGDPAAIWQTLWRRGERLPLSPEVLVDRVPRRSPVELEVAHLFYGHEIRVGRSFRLSITNGSFSKNLEFAIRDAPTSQVGLFDDIGSGVLPSRLALTVSGNPKADDSIIPLTWNGGLTSESIDVAARRNRQRGIEGFPVRLITTESSSADELTQMWNQVALTPAEDLVLKALQFLDPAIERIAAQATNRTQSRGGFIVRRRGSGPPIPIGSMGDGMWRMLAMAIALTQCRGGVLLIDEIDTGLHYTAMSKMWGLVYRAAVEFDVQVFATTHSFDCVHSLAQLSTEVDTPGSFTVQRIVTDKPKSVPYDSDELAAVADRDIEVR